MVKVFFLKLMPEAVVPAYKTSGAAGMDVSACLSERMTIAPGGGIDIVPTGIAIELPDGYEAQIRPRSGLALRHGISLANSPATIDSDYRGEVKIILINHGKEPFVVNHGDRIAQMVIAKTERVEMIERLVLGETERGCGGFGHTGV